MCMYREREEGSEGGREGGREREREMEYIYIQKRSISVVVKDYEKEGIEGWHEKERRQDGDGI